MNKVILLPKVILLIVITIVLTFSVTTQGKTTSEDQLIERFEKKESNLEIHFIDAGYGEPCLIRTPNKTILIDGGEKSSLISYLNNLGLKTIDLLIVTNPSPPYVESLPEVINNIEVKKIIDSGFSYNTDSYKNYLTAVEATKDSTDYIIGRKNMKKEFDNELQLKILSPGKEFFSDPRNNSLVLLVTFKDISFLHTGAIGRPRELELISRENFSVKVENINLLNMSRMGSKHSNYENFIQTINPDIAIFSVGNENPKNLPDPGVIDKLESKNIHRERVDQQGDIIFYSNGKKIKWKE